MGKFNGEDIEELQKLIYILEDGDEVNRAVEGMVANNQIKGCASLSVLQKNAEITLQYDLISTVTLRELFKGVVRKNTLLKTLLSIAETVRQLEEYMINSDYIVWDFDYIFSDIDSLETNLVVLPVMHQNIKQNYQQFIKKLLVEITFEQRDNYDYVGKILNYFNNKEDSSVPGFIDLLRGLLEENKVIMRPAPSTSIYREKHMATSMPPIQQPIVQEVIAPEATTKKKFLFFGKEKKSREKVKPEKLKKEKVKREKPKKEKKQRTSDSIQEGLRIPGISIENKKQRNFDNEQVNSRIFSFSPQQEEAIHIQENQASFGETTLLSAGEMGETTLLAQEGARQTFPRLLVVKTGQEHIIDKEIYQIGYSAKLMDCCLAHNRAISRHHADIILQAGQYYIRDNASKNYTYVNSRKVLPQSMQKLEDENKIRLGDEELVFYL